MPRPSLESYRHNFWLTDKQPPLVSTPGRMGFSCNNAEPPNFSDKVLMARPWQFTEVWAIYLEDHPRTCKWIITMVSKSLSRASLVVIWFVTPLGKNFISKLIFQVGPLKQKSKKKTPFIRMIPRLNPLPSTSTNHGLAGWCWMRNCRGVGSKGISLRFSWR